MHMTVLRADYASISDASYYLDLKDGDAVHKWLTSVCKCKREDERILYRIDTVPGAVFMYIQTMFEFPTDEISKAGFVLLGSFETEKVKKGSSIVFKIFCSTHVEKDNKKMFIEDAEERDKWLRNRFSDCLDIKELVEAKTGSVTIKNGVKLRGTEFSGKGKITDVPAFMDKISSGIGKGKCYGMGLFLYKNA